MMILLPVWDNDITQQPFYVDKENKIKISNIQVVI